MQKTHVENPCIRNWGGMALDRRKQICNLMQQKTLGRLAILTLPTSQTPPHLDPLALKRNL